MLTLVIAYLVSAVIVLAEVCVMVSREEKQRNRTAEPRMWERSIDEFTARVHR